MITNARYFVVCKLFIFIVAASPFVACLSPQGGAPANGAVAIPEAPVLTSAVPGVDMATLAWNPVAESTSYNVYRGGKKVNTAPIFISTYVDSTAESGVTYLYDVTAVNTFGETRIRGLKLEKLIILAPV